MLKPAVKRVTKSNKRVTKSKALLVTANKSLDSAQRHEMIAREAYLSAEKRGFQGGDCVTDWLNAEAKIDSLYAQHH